jgi:type II secretory pathway component PulM
VRERLEAAHPHQASEVPTAVREATRLARSAPSAMTRETAIAHALVKSLYEDGRLDEHQVAAFAEAGKFDEANAAIAALANVPVSIAENMMVETRAEGVMILAKVSGMSWLTVQEIINMRDALSGMAPSDQQACKATYERLRPSTAQQVLRFHRMQQTAAPAA